MSTFPEKGERGEGGEIQYCGREEKGARGGEDSTLSKTSVAASKWEAAGHCSIKQAED